MASVLSRASRTLPKSLGAARGATITASRGYVVKPTCKVAVDTSAKEFQVLEPIQDVYLRAIRQMRNVLEYEENSFMKLRNADLDKIRLTKARGPTMREEEHVHRVDLTTYLKFLRRKELYGPSL